MPAIHNKLLFAALAMTVVLPVSALAGRVPGTGLEFKPSVAVSWRDDSNVFFSDTDPVSDSSLVISPALSLNGELGTGGDRFSVDASSQHERYSSVDVLDNDQYDIAFEGIKNVTRAQRLVLSIEAAQSVDKSNTADSFRDLPDQLDTQSLQLAWEKHTGSIPLGVRAGRTSYRYTRLGDNGQSDADDLRDRDETLVALMTGYGASPQRRVYIEAIAGTVAAKNDVGVDENRDADSRELRLGFRYKTPGLVDIDASIGDYRLQYDTETLGDLSGLVHRIDAAFEITPLTALVFTSRKTFEMTSQRGSPGYESLLNRLKLTHHFGRRIHISAWAERGVDTFVSSPVEDTSAEVGASAGYRFGREFSVFARFSRESRERNRIESLSSDSTEVERDLVEVGIGYGL